MKCNVCNSEMRYYVDKEISVPVGNPTKLKIKANFYGCENCGKELFVQEDLMEVSKKVDETNDKIDAGEIDTIEIPENKVFS